MAKILSFSMSEDEAKELEELEKKMKAGSRSEVVRMALQSLRGSLDELQGKSGHIHAVVLLVDERHRHGAALEELQHRYEESIISSVHNVVHQQCVEMWLVHDDAKKIAALDLELRKSKKLKTVKTVVF